MKRFSLAFSAALLLATASASRADERCVKLEALNQQYAGVQLTAAQKLLKRRLVSWYNKNCASRTASRH